MKELNKIQKTELQVSRLKSIASKALSKKKYNEALAALSACANILYEYNQRYKDDDIENALLEIGKEIIVVPTEFRPMDIHPVKTVLFYDGFGLDLRGLAINMTKIIASLGYKLVYVTNSAAKGKQPHIITELEEYDVEYVYIDMNSNYLKWAESLNNVFLKYSPQIAYYYTTPYDVSGSIVFSQYKNHVIRFLVNLTDHAFWVGLNAFDYCSASRAMGAWINLNERGIPIEKMYKIKSNIYISEKTPLMEIPFDTSLHRYVFSGGALYKTLGDPDNYYYKIIEYIVTTYSDVNFIYAGEGDTSEIDKLIEKFPDRVFLLHERDDFFQIIQGSVFYLNTYPMFGGQMMRYAAYAGKLPITLRHNSDGQGILNHQDELEIEFDTYDAVIEEIDRILTDDIYRNQKENKLKIAVVSKEETLFYYRQHIETHLSPFPVEIEEFDTGKFQHEYLERLNFDKVLESCIARKINYPLIKHYPSVFLKKRIHKFSIK